jgi:hypothetical protein
MKKQHGQIPTALQFFGYRYPPFADTFEIHTPFLGDAEDLMLQRIDALVRQGKSVAIYGDAGTGKSMLVKSITSQLDSKAFRIAQIPYGGMKPSAILRDLCDEFDIDTAGRKNLLSKLSEDFKRRADKPFPVIVVDEAHEMQRQSFLDLCSLLYDVPPPLHLFSSGNQSCEKCSNWTSTLRSKPVLHTCSTCRNSPSMTQRSSLPFALRPLRHLPDSLMAKPSSAWQPMPRAIVESS